MPSPISVKIKVPPYIRKYMIGKSENKVEPLVFSRNHLYGKSLVDKVTHFYRHSHFPVSERENVLSWVMNHWTTHENVTVLLPYNRKKDVRYYNFISINRQQEFINEVKVDFYHELYWYMILRRRKGIQRKEIIRRFMNKYDITEDDISLDSIYRQTSRILKPFIDFDD